MPPTTPLHGSKSNWEIVFIFVRKTSMTFMSALDLGVSTTCTERCFNRVACDVSRLLRIRHSMSCNCLRARSVARQYDLTSFGLERCL